jgi:lysophospholipase L1-like esterase
MDYVSPAFGAGKIPPVYGFAAPTLPSIFDVEVLRRLLIKQPQSPPVPPRHSPSVAAETPLAEETKPRPAMSTRSLLFGDSITRRMAGNMPTNYDCIGLGGADATRLLAYLPKLPNKDYQNVIIQVGINDTRRKTVDTRHYALALIRLISGLRDMYPHANLYICTITPGTIRSPHDEMVRAVANTVIDCTARQFGALVINLDNIFGPATPENIKVKLRDEVHFQPDFQQQVAKFIACFVDGGFQYSPFSITRPISIGKTNKRSPQPQIIPLMNMYIQPRFPCAQPSCFAPEFYNTHFPYTLGRAKRV